MRFGLALLVVAGCVAPRPAAPPPTTLAAPAVVTSNVQRGDYAGSQACAPCHPDEYDAFMAAPMHNMTRLPSAAVPEVPWRGVFRFQDDDVRFTRRGDERLMTIESQRFGTRTFKVTRVIGGRHREDFAGVEVGAADTRDERILPATYFFATRSWRYKGYSVMSPERPGLRPGGVWNRTCIFCHNTVPYLSDMLGALADPSVGPYQGEVVDPLLPPARRARYEITDPAGFGRAVDAELGRLQAPPSRALDAAGKAAELLRATRARFTGADLLEVGIGCESCHGGSLEHVEHNATRPSFTPRAPFLRVTVPVPDGGSPRAAAINRVCARCHQVLFTRYPWTWEGGARRDPVPGGSNINSGEARDFLLGGCAAAMACTDCHDPHAHARPPTAALEARADGVCLRCHGQYASPAARRAHTHHDPAGAGARCLGCHMPRKNMSLDNELGRYHRIGSPTETAKVEGDRPLECALCHGDQPVETLVATMERWWHESYDRDRLRLLYGDDLAHADPLLATLQRGKPHEQAVAITLLGARDDREAAPLIAEQLTHRIPILRYYAVRALERILRTPSPLDVHAPDDVIAAAARSWLSAARERLAARPPTSPPSPR